MIEWFEIMIYVVHVLYTFHPGALAHFPAVSCAKDSVAVVRPTCT